jgi:hypothetical protein
MKNTLEKLGQMLLVLVCFTAYLFFFVAMLAETFNSNIYKVMLGSSLL